ncbi:MAG: hypothetical protein U0903_09985 [Planctomycetales bacterium]
MRDTMGCRGPDGGANSDLPDGKIGLGHPPPVDHRSDDHPQISRCATKMARCGWSSTAGIYNHAEIRAELQRLGDTAGRPITPTRK